MARSGPFERFSKKPRRPYRELNGRGRPKFKNRRASRCNPVDSAVRKPKTDGVWPIVPYIVNCDVVTTPSSSILPFSKTGQKSSSNFRKKSQRFNVFTKLVNEEKQSSSLEFPSLAEETGDVEFSNSIRRDSVSVKGKKSVEPECSKSSCSTLSEVELVLLDEILEETLIERSVIENSSDVESLKNGTKDLSSRDEDTQQLKQNGKMCEEVANIKSNQSNSVEVITLTDDEEEIEESVEFLEGSDEEVTVIKEIVSTSQLISASSAVKVGSSHTIPSKASRQKMPSYSYRVLKQLFYNVANSPLARTNLCYLPPADASVMFNDLLSEGTAQISGRLLRCWKNIQKSACKGLKFRFCSYNVLCQDTMENTAFLYKHLRNWGMEWSVRSSLLARELAIINADVLCLQEVQQTHFSTFFQRLLDPLGYKGVFKKRTRAMLDGCAVFYKSDFDLISHIPIEYFVSTSCILNKDNVGQIVRLKDKRTGREFCVANTHLLFNTKRGDIKLAQLSVLLAHLEKNCGSSAVKPCPYILCGDFNMSPYCPIYNFLLENSLTLWRLPRNELSGQGSFGGPFLESDFMPRETSISPSYEDEKSSNHSNVWTHNLNFASVYNHYDDYDKPEISSFNSMEALNPDFIFYAIDRKVVKEDEVSKHLTMDVFESSLKLLRRLSLPNEEALRSTLGPWPNYSVPSDHIPLIAEFSIT